MSRYTGPVCRLCRREGIKLYLKGEKCYGPKCPLSRRPYPPGADKTKRQRRKMSEYAIRLREKQKLRRHYHMSESQFRRFFEMAESIRGRTDDNLVILLERRLDNVIYRLGLAPSRKAARQMVSHGHFLVNGRRVTIPSYLVKSGDVIEVRERSKKLDIIKSAVESINLDSIPEWLEFDLSGLKARVVNIPTMEQIDLDIPVNTHFIVEFYSR